MGEVAQFGPGAYSDTEDVCVDWQPGEGRFYKEVERIADRCERLPLRIVASR